MNPETRQKWLPALAPAVLTAVALAQITLTQVEELTPWKGGGFGMFSTIDSPSARVLRLELHTESGVVPVEIPPSAKRAAEEARAMPTQARLEALALELSRLRWMSAPGGDDGERRLIGLPDELALPETHPLEPVSVDAVEVGLWRVGLDAERLHLHTWRALEARVDLPTQPIIPAE